MTILTPKRDLLVPPGTNAKVRSAAVAKLMARKVELDIPPLVDIPVHAERWMMLVSQVTIKQIGSVILTEQHQDDQLWSSGIGRVMATGPALYMGRQFSEKGLTPEHAPKVGDFVIFNAKSPIRFKYKDRSYIWINDDTTFGRIPSDKIEEALNNISFAI
jgi:co-chaperonin GroES (HSP10)